MEIVKESNRFLQLLKFIEQGWEIDEPVMVGAMWHPGPNASNNVYHFVLRNKSEDTTTLLSLQSSLELLTFLSENNIQVNLLSW